ncbi:class F sortase [Microbacterium sp. LjRoot45]|uniref:class F sortase n=1 Tax=Microbacterium sp. LjRoot45 TaxID=3342329 RepID=UPI003ECFF592
MNRRGTSGAIAIGVVVIVSLLTACSPAAPTAGEQAVGGAGVPQAVATERPTPAVDVPVAQATLAPVDASARPVELRIPAIDADLRVKPVGVQDDGSMEIPENPAVAGWYRYGPTPGADEGSAVIAAHVDSRVLGIGPLAQLRDLDEGAKVQVRDEDGETTDFTVVSVRYIPRAELPVEDLFSRSGESSLVIITCGGSFDEATRTYSDNVVAVARPEG